MKFICPGHLGFPVYIFVTLYVSVTLQGPKCWGKCNDFLSVISSCIWSQQGLGNLNNLARLICVIATRPSDVSSLWRRLRQSILPLATQDINRNKNWGFLEDRLSFHTWYCSVNVKWEWWEAQAVRYPSNHHGDGVRPGCGLCMSTFYYSLVCLCSLLELVAWALIIAGAHNWSSLLSSLLELIAELITGAYYRSSLLELIAGAHYALSEGKPCGYSPRHGSPWFNPRPTLDLPNATKNVILH